MAVLSTRLPDDTPPIVHVPLMLSVALLSTRLAEVIPPKEVFQRIEKKNMERSEIIYQTVMQTIFLLESQLMILNLPFGPLNN